MSNVRPQLSLTTETTMATAAAKKAPAKRAPAKKAPAKKAPPAKRKPPPAKKGRYPGPKIKMSD